MNRVCWLKDVVGAWRQKKEPAPPAEARRVISKSGRVRGFFTSLGRSVARLFS